MEYDRALYRVYERIMEDLNSSPSPLLLTTTLATSSSLATVTAASPLSSTMTNESSAAAFPRGHRRRGLRNRRVEEADGSPALSPDSAAYVEGDDDSNEDENDDHNDNDDSNHLERRGGGGGRRGRIAGTVVARHQGRQLSTTITTMATLQHRRRRRQHQPLPFLLPIWMSRKIDQIIVNYQDHHYHSNSNIATYFVAAARMLWSISRDLAMLGGGSRSRSRGDGMYDRVAMSPSAAATTRQQQQQYHRSLSPTPGDPPDNRDLGTSPHHSATGDNDDVEGGRLRPPSLNSANDEDADSFLHRSPSSSSSEGLRRRSPTRRSGGGGRGVHEGAITASPPPSIPHLHAAVTSNPSSTLPQQQFTNPRVGERGASSTSSSNNAAYNATPTSRGSGNSTSDGINNDDSDYRSSSSSGEDTDSEDNATSNGSIDDSDNDQRRGSSNNSRHDATDLGGGGCSQLNLYGAMRLSLTIAIIHIFVLIALHVTYVGPYAFRGGDYELRQQQWQSHQRRRLLTRRGRLDDDLMAITSEIGEHVNRDDVESDDDWDANVEVVAATATKTAKSRRRKVTNDTPTPWYSCISYALSDRPIEDRSKYVEKEDDKVSSSDKRRLFNEGWGNLDSNNNKGEERRKRHHDGYYYDDQFPHSSAGNSVVEVEDYDNFSRVMAERGTRGMTGTSSSGNNPPYSAPAPLLGKDEILQIKILYGGFCTGKCSRVHAVKYEEEIFEEEDSSNTDDQEDNVPPYSSGGQRRAVQASDERNNTNDISGGQQRRQKHVLRGLQRQANEQLDNDEDRERSDGLFLSSPSYWEKVHYRFARDDALLQLDEKTVSLHNVTFVNVTLTERCLSTGSDDGKLTLLTASGEFLSQVYGMDSIIINELMYGIRGTDGSFTSGYVMSLQTQERWGWSHEQLEAFEQNSFIDWATRKLGVLLLSTLAFVLITSVTSLIVRVLTSSGVVLMFPLFTFFRAIGLPGADERILSLSYPWIGTARMAIANRRVHPQRHLVWAHCMKIVLYYVMYEACQAAWSVVLYAKSIPEGLPVWIFGFAMIWEYFSMVFVRSALSVHFFPRLALVYFFCYHVYFYSVPYGYFDVALIPLFFLMMHAMLYTILGLEAPNAARGMINVECPREVYNRLSWQEPVAALPAEWTMFLPLNSRVSPLHDRDVSNGVASIADANAY